MTQTSRRTGRAALPVAVSLATALLASACSTPARHTTADPTPGSHDTTLPRAGIDRGIQLPGLPGLVPGDRLAATPVTPHRHHHANPNAGTTDPATHPHSRHHTATKAHRHAKTQHAPKAPKAPKSGHALKAGQARAAHHAATTAAPPTASEPATNQPATQGTDQPTNQGANPAGPAWPGWPADHRPLWIGTPAEHPIAEHPIPVHADQPPTGTVVIPVTMPAGEGPLRPDTVISGPGYQIDLRQRPAAPAPGTVAPLTH